MDPDGKFERTYVQKDIHDVIGANVMHPIPMATHTYIKSAGYPDGIYRVNCLVLILTQSIKWQHP